MTENSNTQCPSKRLQNLANLEQKRVLQNVLHFGKLPRTFTECRIGCKSFETTSATKMLLNKSLGTQD